MPISPYRTHLGGVLSLVVLGTSLLPVQPGSAQSYRQVEQIRREQRSLPAAGVRRLIVDGWGDVQVNGVADGRITATASLRAWAPTADEAAAMLSSLRWFLDPAGGAAVRAGGSGPTAADAVRYRGRRYGKQAQLDLALTVPPGVVVHVVTAQGDVSVTGTAGATVDVKEGTITVRQISGEADLRTQAGAISAEGVGGRVWLTAGAGALKAREIAGQLVAKTGNGAIDVRAVRGAVEVTTRNGRVTAHDLAGGLTATTTTGSISADTIKGPVELRSTYGRIAGSALAGPLVSAQTRTGAIRLIQGGMPSVRYELQTGQGSIDLTVPATASLQADLQTSTGRIETTLPFATAVTSGPQSERRRVVGPINGGRYRLQARTDSGAIVVRAAR